MVSFVSGNSSSYADLPRPIEQLVGDKEIPIRNKPQTIEALRRLDVEKQRSWLLRFACCFKLDETVVIVIEESIESLKKDSQNRGFCEILSEIVEERQYFRRQPILELNDIWQIIHAKGFHAFAQICFSEEESKKSCPELFDHVFLKALMTQDARFLHNYYKHPRSPSEKALGIGIILGVGKNDYLAVEEILNHYSTNIGEKYLHTAAFLARELCFSDLETLLRNELETLKETEPSGEQSCSLM